MFKKLLWRYEVRISGLILSMCFYLTGFTQNHYQERLKEMQLGLPKDVGGLIQRIIECNHWAGEDGYDLQRRMHIEAMWNSLSCDSIDEDKEDLLVKHADIKCKIEEALNKASTFVI